MIDSVLKGTGNSRFLKSSVPAGTSWADALAMLQAGTFPIDFNGINAEGFQQVGTPLNKANLLKDATAAQIGLPPSTTPDGMFQALGNTGELHVWRKTVVTGTAKVELEPAVSGYIVSNNGSSYNQTIKYSSTIDEKGNLSGTITTLTVSYNTSNSDLFVLKGKYFEAGTTEISSNLKSPGGVWYIPNDASIQYITGQPNTTGYPYYYTHVATKMQKVVYVPAGTTTTTYPVSTNPNAYQEGSDAKPAGYTLGDVVSGNFRFGNPYSSNTGFRMDASASVSVDDNGNVSLAAPITTKSINKTNVNTKAEIQQLMLGKYVIADKYTYPQSDDIPGGIVIYIPSDATINMDTDAGSWRLSKYQPVTGYPAIPAVTTIEYLGKLGDKARVRVVSYVGTGISGSAHPTTVTFDFVPKVVIAHCKDDAQYRFIAPYGIKYTQVRNSLNDNALTITWNNKVISYQNKSPDFQMNISGKTYIVVAIG